VIVCVVTSPRRRAVLEHGRTAVRAGIDLIQLRDPDLEGAALEALASGLVHLSASSPTRVVVNERLDVAITAGAHGVHLRSVSIPPVRARSLAPPGFLIGQSVHCVDEAVAAAPYVDYLIAGTVFPSTSKPGLRTHLGSEGLAAIVRAVDVPVLAIGGMSLSQVEAVAATGAAGIAGIELFDRDEEGLLAVVSELRHRFDRVRSAS
jgi:thiamine-phosphate pyrophosphorylase